MKVLLEENYASECLLQRDYAIEPFGGYSFLHDDNGDMQSHTS